MNRKSIFIAFVMLLAVAVVARHFALHWQTEHPSQTALRQDIIAQNGFEIVSQQQDISAHFELLPSWIPTQKGTKNVIHHVFYHAHNTQIYVDSVERTSDGNVRVYINSTIKYLKNGGSFVTSLIWNKSDNGRAQLTTIPWNGVNQGRAGTVLSPMFTSAISHHSLTFNDEAGGGPLNELMFGIREKDVNRYFSTPVVVSIPDFNLVSYVPS